MEVMASTGDPYDANLTYDERRRLRKLNKEQKTQKNSGYESGGSSSSSSSHYSSSSYPRPTPSTNSQTRLQNGRAHHRAAPSPPVAQVADRVAMSRPSNGEKIGFDTDSSGKTHSKPSSSHSVQSHIISTHHTPHSTANKPRTYSDSTILERTSDRPPPLSLGGHASSTTSTRPPLVTRSCSPQSPHSPVVLARASSLLSGVIARQQERERICSNSSSPVATPTDVVVTPSGTKNSDTFKFGNGSYTVGTSGQHPEMKSPSPKPTYDNAFSSGTEPKANSIGSSHADSANYSVDIEDRTGSRLSTLSSSSSFAFDSFDQLMSPINFKSDTETPSPVVNGNNRDHSFSNTLRFVETDSPVSPYFIEEPTTIRGAMQKTNVVYGSHDEDVSLITRIPSSGFFDPSQTQSQGDALRGSALIGGGGTEVGLIEEKPQVESSSEKRRSKRSKRSPLRLLQKKGVADKIMEEEEEADADVSSKGETSRKKERKSSKQKTESDFSPEHKSLSPLRKVSSGSRLPPQHSSAVTTPTKAKISQSFRIEKPLSPDCGGLTKFSMPNLATPSPSPGRSREVTPDSGGSDTSGGKKRKASFAKRIMSLVVGGSKDESKPIKPTMDNPVVLKNYRIFEEEIYNTEGSTDNLTSYSSSPLLPTIRTSDGGGGEESNLRTSHSVRAGSKVVSPVGIKRSSSLTPTKTKGKKVSSGDKVPTNGAGSRTKGADKSSPVSSRKTSGRKVSGGTTKSTPRKTSGASTSSPKSSPASTHRTSTSSISSPKSSRPISPRKSASSSSISSPKSSPISPRKSPISPRKSPLTSTTTTSGKSSPFKANAASPRGSPVMGKTTSVKSSIVIIHNKSPRSSPMTTKKVISSSTGTKRAPSTGTKKVPSTGTKKAPSRPEVSNTEDSTTVRCGSPSSNSSGRKIMVTSVRSPVSSPVPGKKVDTTAPIRASPLLKRKGSNASTASTSSSSRLGVSSPPQVFSPQSSTRRPSSPRVSAPRLSSPRLSRKQDVSGKPSTAGGKEGVAAAGKNPPHLSKVGLTSSKSDVMPTSSNGSFSRTAKGRRPLKMKSSDDVPSAESTRSHSQEEEPVSPLSSSSESRRRRLGVSLTESPLASPTLGNEFVLGSPIADSAHQPPVLEPRVKSDMTMESLMASVEEKLNSLAQSQDHPSSPPLGAEFFVPENSPPQLRRGSAPNTSTVSKSVLGSGKLTSIVEKKSPTALRKALIPSKSTSTLTKSFTASRPPKAPQTKKTSEPHPTGTRGEAKGSHTGVSRPRLVVVDKSPRTSVAGEDSLKSKSSIELGASKTKKTSVGNVRGSFKSKSSTQLGTAVGMSPVRSGSDISTGSLASPVRGSNFNRSTRKSSRIRPGSANAAVSAPRRHSLTPAPVASSSFNRSSAGQASGRKSMRRGSISDQLVKKIRPVASTGTLPRERKNSGGGGGINARGGAALSSMRRSSTTLKTGGSAVPSVSEGAFSSMRRPKSSSALRPSAAVSTTAGTGASGTGTGSNFSRSSVTMSMRVPRNSIAGQRGSALRKSSRVAPPTVALTETPVSPSRRSSLKKSSSGGTLRRMSSLDAMDAFDQISSQASANILTSSDHRRAVRPKLRQKASTTHLKMLHQRKDVSSTIDTTDEDSSKQLDPNSYSTYMGKKNLAPSAMAGLAANVDFSTVKLRKTVTMKQLDGSPMDDHTASPNPSACVEYNTSHPIMLLQIKGRRYVQTRLVEPSATSLNSGDVFLALSKDKLFHWVGKSSNVIEKARGSDIVMRIIHKKELGCKVTTATLLKEEERSLNLNSKRYDNFWGLIGGKKAVKSSESAPSDDLHEKAVNLATTVYLLEGDKDKHQFVPIHEGTTKNVTYDMLDEKKILLFDFYSEMYVWIGYRSQANMRKKAVELGRQMFDAGCRPPVYNLRCNPTRASGRYRPKTSIVSKTSSRNSTLNASGRRMSRVKKSDVEPRPSWALFARVTEGAESILFREKFCDWPEQGRIIKQKGHPSSGDTMMEQKIQIELQPADVDKMLKDTVKFEGLRLEGDNIHRGLGNYKVSKSSFSCNRVRTIEVKKWVIKEFDNVPVASQNVGMFFSNEAYVIRWGYQISVVRELEGLTPGMGMFARDRAYQKSLLQAKGVVPEVKKPVRQPDDSDSSADEEEEEEDVRESGGRDRCAYFFWQGNHCTINEKGASALMTVELDKEKGPQIRVTQGKEPPAFLALFNGGIMILNGRSDVDSLQSRSRTTRIFYVQGQEKNEACLVEVTPSDEKQPIGSQLRSRGCYVVLHVTENRLFVWYGSKCTKSLRKSASVAARMLRNRLNGTKLIKVNEGEEPNDMLCLLGNKEAYISMANETRLHQHTPRLFEMSSTIGEFVGNEVVFPARSGEVESFTFDQNDLYSVNQPAIFLVDGFTEVYVWLGWWPQQNNQLLREANATTGSSYSNWLRDKKLAMETTQHYIKACKRTRTPRAYVVMAGSEHERFKNLFPSWEDNKTVQGLNCKGVPVPKRTDVETELLKYSRTEFKLEDLKQKPLPEGVDPSKLEGYLSNEEFMRVFKVDKMAFSKLPLWKQTKQKKEVGLF